VNLSVDGTIITSGRKNTEYGRKETVWEDGVPDSRQGLLLVHGGFAL